MFKHTNNSSATADDFFECVWPFCAVLNMHILLVETKRYKVNTNNCDDLEMIWSWANRNPVPSSNLQVHVSFQIIVIFFIKVIHFSN